MSITDEARQTGLNYLSAAELADRLRVSKRWVQEYTRKGVIPARKVGQVYFYDAHEVDRAIRAL